MRLPRRARDKRKEICDTKTRLLCYCCYVLFHTLIRVVGRDAQIINIQPRTVPPTVVPPVREPSVFPMSVPSLSWQTAGMFGMNWRNKTRFRRKARFRVAQGEEPRGYTSWHRDEGTSDGVFVHPLITTNIKLIVAVGDQKNGAYHVLRIGSL